MGLFEILSLILSVFGSGMAIYAQDQANQQNIANANEMLDKQQQYARENATTANETTENLYYNLYSPKAQVQQLKDAGLSPGMFYSHGGGLVGTAAAQAATPTAQVPTINPIVDNAMMNRIVEATKTASETSKNEKEGNKIDQDITESNSRIALIEEQTKTQKVSTLNLEYQNKALEIQNKLAEATLNDSIELVKENLRLVRETANKAIEEINGLKIENKKKEELLDAEIKKLQAEEKKLVQEEILVKAQQMTEYARKTLTENQGKYSEKQVMELERKLDAIDRYGYLAVNGGGWQDRVVGLLLDAIGDLAEDATLGDVLKMWWKSIKESAKERKKDKQK